MVAVLAAQETTVRGKVTSASDGEPLAGVTVQIKGTTNGTATNNRGEFEIQVPDAGAYFFRNPSPEDIPTLVFSYTGFQAREVLLEGQTRLDLELQPDVTMLNEVVVTGTAAGQTQRALSFSVGRIDEPLMTTVTFPNAGTGLQGKVAGLRTSHSGGQPGQEVYFQIRSANSIANGQQPLIVVDGIFLDGAALADLNAEDIEKVEVLKGPAGAALYGSQAANGVIQIFTRRGQHHQVGETKVIYRGEVGYSEELNRYNISNFTNREVLDPDGPQPILGNPTEENINNIPLPNLQDYQDAFLFQKGAYISNYLAVQGKTERSNFLASAQRLRDEGILQSSEGYTRNSFRLNFDHQLSNKFGLRISTLYSLSNQDLLPLTSNGPGSFLAGTLFMTPMFNLDATNEEDGSAYDWDIDNTGFGTTNPLYDRANARRTLDRTRFLGGVTADYYATEWLTFSLDATLDRLDRRFEHFVEKGYLSTNVPGDFRPLVTANIQRSNGGGIQRKSLTGSSFTSRFSATARRRFGAFNTALRASILYEDITHSYNDAIGENLAVENVRSLDNAQSNVFISSNQEEIIAYSGFLVGDIDYNEKFIFSGLFRREGSSLFGPEERWANYYRISGAYRISKDVKIPRVDELKLRASLGTAGIRPLFDQRFETFELVNGSITKKTLGNNFLRPALSREMEVGVDAILFKAFRVEFNYANIETKDQILLTPLSGGAGFYGQWRNAATLEAKVYEVTLNTDFAKLFKIRSAAFKWDLMVTFDRVQQTVKELQVAPYNTGPDIQQSSLFRIEEGASFGVMVGEVFATNLDQLADQEGINPNDYTINEVGYVVRKDQLGTASEVPYKLVDAGGNPLIRPIGDINPDFRMGFANTISYKGFNLYTLFDWKKGGDIYNMTRQWLYRDQRHGDVSNYPGVAASFFGSNGLYNNLVGNNHFVEDGSFFMLREAAFSYTITMQGARRFIESIRLSFIGRNLFTITDYSGFHPDVTSPPRENATLNTSVPDGRGIDIRTPNGDPSLFVVDAFNYPLRRSFTFGFQVTF